MKLSRLLLGEDIFISYSRADGTAYAAGLADLLSRKGFTCFLDQWGSEPGREIPLRVLRTLRRSSMLVLVGSARAANSEAVEREVVTFLATGRPIVPISIDGALEEGRWFSRIAGASMSVEAATRFADGRPGEPVVGRIESSFRFTKRNTRVRRAFVGAGAILLVLSVVAAWLQQQAARATTVAEQKTALAAAAQNEAVRQAEVASEQARLARENAARAREQEAAALANAQRAQEQQRLAEERMARARSLELASSAQTVLEAEPDLAALLAVASFATRDTFEARQALLSALSRRPRLEAVLRGPQEGRRIARGRVDSGRIMDATFSADGGLVAVRDWDGAISLWPASTTPRAQQAIVPEDGVRDEAISHDFGIVVGLRWKDQAVRVRRRAGPGQGDVVFQHPYGEVSKLAVSPDGTLIATGSANGAVALWSARDGSRVGEPVAPPAESRAEAGTIALVHPVTVLLFSPDGRILHWRTSAGVAGAIDVATRQPAPMLPEGIGARAAFAAEGAELAFIGDDGSLLAGRLYKGKLENRSQLLPRERSISAVAISPDGMLVAGGGSDGHLYLFDRRTSRSPSASIRGHAGAINALAFSRDGSRLVSGGDDRTVMLWRTQQVQLHEAVGGTALRLPGMVTEGTVRFTADGRRLLVAAGESILVLDAARATPSGPPIRCEGAELAGLALHPDGTTVAGGSYGHRLLFADLERRVCAERPRSPRIVVNRSVATALTFSPDGTLLASGDTEGGLAVWNVAANLRGRYLKEPVSDGPPVNSIVWTRDGAALAIGSAGHDRLWRVNEARGPVALQGRSTRSRYTAMSADGRLLAGSTPDGVDVWDVASGRIVARFAVDKAGGHLDEDTVSALAFGPGAALLAVGQKHGRLSLFDVNEARWLADLPLSEACLGSECAVLSLDFSPKEERLAALVGNEVLLWRFDPQVWVRRACELANRGLTQVEQRRYLRSEPGRRLSCGGT